MIEEVCIESQVSWHPYVKKWCNLPYNGKKGCPNFNKRPGCPMDNEDIPQLIDIEKPVYIVGLIFDLEAHRNKMKVNNPTWNLKQLNNVLYWQSSAVKTLTQIVNRALLTRFVGYKAIYKPEAYGVNLTRMLKKAPMPISWEYPLKKIYYVALLGEPK